MNYYFFFIQVSFANRFNCNINGFCRFYIFCLCDADIKLKITSRKCNKICANYITLKFKNVSLFLRFPDFCRSCQGKVRSSGRTDGDQQTCILIYSNIWQMQSQVQYKLDWYLVVWILRHVSSSRLLTPPPSHSTTNTARSAAYQFD